MKKNSTLTLRKLLVLLAAVALLVCLGGCNFGGASDDPSDAPSDGSSESQIQTEAPTDAPADPTEPPETEPPAVMGTVTADNLNVRSNPSTDSTVLRQLDINTRVVIIEQKMVGDVRWARIADGWVNMNYILVDGEEPAPTEPEEEPDEPTGEGTPAVVTADELNIRKGPGTSFDPVGKYKKGDKVEILETKDGWAKTSKGWVSQKYLKVEDNKKDDQKDETPDIDKDTEIVSDGKNKVLGYGVVDIGTLNVRSGPGTKYDVVDKVSQGKRAAYYQKSGNWVRIESGWVSTGYFYIEGTKGDDATTGTITGDGLNIRTGPGTGYKTNGSYKKGEKVEILHIIDGWGCTSKGWISMKNVDTGDKTTESKTNATVTGDNLNIRKGPGTSYDAVGQYDKGDRITILETKDGWYRTDKGWVKADYVKKD